MRVEPRARASFASGSNYVTLSYNIKTPSTLRDVIKAPWFVEADSRSFMDAAGQFRLLSRGYVATSMEHLQWAVPPANHFPLTSQPQHSFLRSAQYPAHVPLGAKHASATMKCTFSPTALPPFLAHPYTHALKALQPQLPANASAYLHASLSADTYVPAEAQSSRRSFTASQFW